MSTPLENYALIGDLETAALVSLDGSIDWLCWPRFDSDACFAALLGSPEHGRWSIAPADHPTRRERRYQKDTMIVETDLHTPTGAVRLIDFMPERDGPSALIRIVQGLHGRVAMRMDLALRFDYGRVRPWSEPGAHGFVARIGPDMVALHTKAPMCWAEDRAHSEFDVAAGERLDFVLRYATSDQPPPPSLDAEAMLGRTQLFWRDWIGRFDDGRTAWPGAVRRSLLTLKAMVSRTSGGLIAAPTTSLPEAPGGTLNWDYRYCWLRDASFTISTLSRAGFVDEAERWRDWLLRAVGGQPEQLQIMYRVDGGRRLEEREIDLPGWRHARPVRIGNAAAQQMQVDVYGELLHSLNIARQAGVRSTAHEREVAERIACHLAKVWRCPGAGVWEARGEPRHHVYSKAMAWVGIETFRHRVAAEGGDPGALEALSREIHRETVDEGWNEGLGYITQYFGGQELDGSVLRLPLLGFLPATHPKMAATIRAIRERLNDGGLIRRKAHQANGPNEGAFLACSCWMANCLNLQGKREEAVAQFERVLALCNDVGLLSEEYDVPGKHLCGNFPQALTHLAVVNTALALSDPEPARQF